MPKTTKLPRYWVEHTPDWRMEPMAYLGLHPTPRGGAVRFGRSLRLEES